MGCACLRKCMLGLAGFKIVPIDKKFILNVKESSREQEKCEAPVELSKNLFKQLLKLKGKYLAENGKVNYSGIREDSDFKKFEYESSLLQLVDLTSLNELERLAFFINIYNVLTLHGIFVHAQKNTLSLMKLHNFWQTNAYKIGDMVFCLDDVEHGVLRCNKLNPVFNEPCFKEGDARLIYVQKILDPRIHFALNCGAHSCPPLRVFSSENLNQGLKMAAENFLRESTTVFVKSKKIRISKLLKWYRSDFGNSDNEVIGWLEEYLTESQKSMIADLHGQFKIIYEHYDWSLV